MWQPGVHTDTTFPASSEGFSFTFLIIWKYQHYLWLVCMHVLFHLMLSTHSSSQARRKGFRDLKHPSRSPFIITSFPRRPLPTHSCPAPDLFSISRTLSSQKHRRWIRQQVTLESCFFAFSIFPLGLRQLVTHITVSFPLAIVLFWFVDEPPENSPLEAHGGYFQFGTITLTHSVCANFPFPFSGVNAIMGVTLQIVGLGFKANC